MKSSTEDQAEGAFHQEKGKLKEVAGEVNDNPNDWLANLLLPEN